MAAFATVDDLADYLGRDDRFGDPTEYRQAFMLLDLASAEIRAWTRQTIDLVSNDAVTLVGSWSPVLELPERPVVSVSSVGLNGQTYTVESDFELAAGALLLSGAVPAFSGYTGATGRSGHHWGGPGSVVAVTYTHGFATIPAVVKTATLAIASRMLSGGGMVRQESVAGHSVTYANPGSTPSLTGTEMASLRYLRRTW